MGFFAILSSTMSKNPVLNPFATSLGTPSNLIGFVASASTIPGILISLPAASLSDVFGRRKFLLFAGFVFASAPFLYLVISNWWQLILVRFYHGFATAIFVPVTEAAIAERFPKKRGERISILNSATAVGRTSAPFLGGSILFLTNNGFPILYLAVGMAGVAAFVVTLLFITEGKDLAPRTGGAYEAMKRVFQGWSVIAKTRNALIVSLVQGSQYYVYGTVEFFLVGYLVGIAKLDLFSTGIITGSQGVALILSRPLMGRFSDTAGRRSPIFLGSTISCVMVLLFPFTTRFPILLLLSIGYGLGFAMVISSTSPLMCEVVPPALIGASLGFLAMMMDVGQYLGPTITQYIPTTAMQYPEIFISLSALLLATSIIFILSGTAKKEKTSACKEEEPLKTGM
jgi:DHA1 family multidrug resistance protein-like MFS transporter